MRNITAVITLMSALLISCEKLEMTKEYTSVVFNYELVESGSMITTKGSMSTDKQRLVAAISNTLPQIITFNLISLDDSTKYTCNTSESITLPIGKYAVDFEYIRKTGSESKRVFSKSNTEFLSRKPSFVIKDTITLTNDTKHYSLKATYTSFAIAYYTHQNDIINYIRLYADYRNDSTDTWYNSEEIIIPPYNEDDFLNNRYINTCDNIAFFFYTNISPYTTVSLIVNNNLGKENNYVFGCDKVNNGKYYIFHSNIENVYTVDTQYNYFEEGILEPCL